VLSNPAQDRKIDPNSRLRVALAVLSGAAFYENIFFVIFTFRILINKGPVTFLVALISSALAFIYVIVILVYLFKGRQDGSFMYPVTIFGIIQAIMITVLRLFLFISLIIYYQESSRLSVYILYFISSTLIGALVCVSQTVIQFLLLRKDLALTVSRVDEY
jgi:hypothetical protein